MRSTLVVPVLFVSLPDDCTSTREQKLTKRCRKWCSAGSSSHHSGPKRTGSLDLCGLLETKREHCEGLVWRTQERWPTGRTGRCAIAPDHRIARGHWQVEIHKEDRHNLHKGSRAVRVPCRAARLLHWHWKSRTSYCSFVLIIECSSNDATKMVFLIFPCRVFARTYVKRKT